MEWVDSTGSMYEKGGEVEGEQEDCRVQGRSAKTPVNENSSVEAIP